MDSWVIVSLGLLVAGCGLWSIAIVWHMKGSRPSTTSRRQTGPSTGSTETGIGTSTDERLRLLETQVRSLELEWQDTYSKLSRLAGRVAKTKALDDGHAKTDDAPVNRHALLARARKD